MIIRYRTPPMTKEQSFAYYQGCEPEEMFDVKETKIALSESARLFDSYVCECCGETAGSNWIRIQNGKKLCIDCYRAYDRFRV